MQDSTVKITITAVDGATKVFTGVGDAAVKQANRAAAAWQKANDVSNVSIESSGSAAAATNKAAKAQDNLAASTRRSYVAQTALTTVLSASINKAFLEMVDVTGQAIQRVDLIAQFPAAMSALGLSASDATVSLAKLSQYVGSIGGNLQEATTSVARFAEVTGNVKVATAEFVGLNNALIAGGAGAQVQANALEQFIQAYSRGIPQLIEWRSLMVAMPAQLNQVAKAMNFVNAGALGEALTNGKVSMQDFVTQLTKMSAGTGPILSQAEARMNGIQFAFNRFKNTLVEGMTAIIQTIGRQNIINFFELWSGVVRQLAVYAIQLISVLFGLFNIISRVFGGPQLQLAKDDTAAIGDNLGGAADHAGDLADGLDDASKAAKKTAGQLASFDKMNVLSEPSDSSGGKDKTPSAAGAPLSAADASALEGIFNGIGGKLTEVNGLAKVLAGILASIVASKFAQGLLDQFNGLVKTAQDFKKNMEDAFKSGQKSADSFNKSIGEMRKSFDNGFGKGADAGGAAKSFMSTLGKGLLTGVSGAIGGALVAAWPAISAALAPVVTGIVTAIGGAFAAIAGLPVLVIVAIIAAVAAIIVGIVLLITHWDDVVKFFVDTGKNLGNFFADLWKNITKWFGEAWQNTTKFFSDLWKGMTKVVSDAIGAISKVVSDVFAAIAQNPFVKAVIDVFKFIGDVVLAGILIAAKLLQIGFVLAMGAIGTAVKAVGQFFQDMWNGIVAVVNIVGTFFATEFQKAWDAIVSIFGTVGDWFKEKFEEAWNNIMTVWAVVSDWFNKTVWVPLVNLFTPVVEFFGDLFARAWNMIAYIWALAVNWFNETVWTPIVNLFTPAVEFFGGLFSRAWTAIKNAFNAVGNFFSGIWKSITDIFGNVSNFFRDAFTNAYNAITTAFGRVKDFVGGLWNGIASGLKSAMQGALNILYSGMRSVAGFINGIIDKINSVASKVGVGKIPLHIDVGATPQLARGGIVDQPTFAMIGEAGKEAVVPLENNLEWIDKLADKINSTSGGNGQPIQLTVQIGEDKITDKLIDAINEKSQMSGRNVILV